MCTWEAVEFVPPDGMGVRIHARLWFDGALLVDFAIGVRRQAGHESHEIARIDCAHGEVHLHRFSRGGIERSRARIVTIIGPESVYRAWDDSWDTMIGGYREMVRQWEEG